MEKRYNLLSLDPMYSPLHEKVASLVARRKFAITSCLSKKVYLPTFKLTLATSLIASVKEPIDNDVLKKMNSLSTYHHAYAKKIESRTLSSSELKYMAKFYIGLKRFITEKSVDLVILHNDTRWYHTIAILLCNELGISYLVTEQGLLRPFTTVIDNKGVNANANISLLNKKIDTDDNNEFLPRNTHDSLLSMMFFSFFILSFSLERLFGRRTVLRYMHNGYSVRKYYKRLVRKLKNNNQHNKSNEQLEDNSALLLLQLEHDSQFLMYSDFYSNQEVIDRVYEKCSTLGLKLGIKKHPLDFNEYRLESSAYFVDGSLVDLINEAKIVITINSSAIVTVLKSQTPLFVVGDSMYQFGLALEHCRIEMINIENKQCNLERQKYLKKLKDNYLLVGAGYDYCPSLLKRKLKQLLD
ncbi:capsular polysaccharide export protein, LipB/KpsS family [Vibrio alginolyticus]